MIQLLGNSWGYVTDLKLNSPATLISRLVDTVSKNGNYLLNISPKADGTIPEDQQNILLEIGRWLDTNGEAIYGTHNWIQFGEVGCGQSERLDVRFTVKDNCLYAIILAAWPGSGSRAHDPGDWSNPTGEKSRALCY